jgi:membrane associated rhomboid family serine protease
MHDASVGHQCPECVREGRRTVRPTRTAFGGGVAGVRGYVTNTLIGLNVLMALVTVVASGRASSLGGGGLGGLLGNSTPVHYWGALVALPTVYGDRDGNIIATVDGVAAGEYYRLVTSMFLHYGVFHLLMNMWALLVLGRQLEAAFGPVRFAALYLLSGLGGSAAVYMFSPPHTLSAGASGAIFGLFSAYFLALKRLGRDTSAVVPILVLNLVITFAVPNISIAAHLGGMLTGAAVGAGLAYAPRKYRTPVQVATLVAAAVILLIVTLARTASLTL